MWVSAGPGGARAAAVATVAVLALLTGCAGGSPSAGPSPSAAPTAPATPTPSVGPTPTPSRPSPTSTQRLGGLLRYGDRGPEVRILQRRLTRLGYFLPVVDGSFGGDTLHAVVAFQKVNGLARDGVVGPLTRRALADPVRPLPAVAGDGPRIEADLGRQVVYLVAGGGISRIFDASSGSGLPYSENGSSGVAVTPLGHFTVARKIDGWDTSPLGVLWRPAYFHGGYALHGAPSVPPYPASHGCIRVTIAAMDYLYPRLPLGTPVDVHA